MTRLRAESSIKKPLRCKEGRSGVMKRPCESFVFCEILGRGRRVQVSCGWTETGGDRKIPSFRDRCPSHGDSSVGGRRSLGGVGAGPPSPSEGGGRLPGRLRRRRGQMTETIEDLAACGALCVPVEKADAKAMLQGGAGDTSIPVNEK